MSDDLSTKLNYTAIVHFSNINYKPNTLQKPRMHVCLLKAQYYHLTGLPVNFASTALHCGLSKEARCRMLQNGLHMLMLRYQYVCDEISVSMMIQEEQQCACALQYPYMFTMSWQSCCSDYLSYTTITYGCCCCCCGCGFKGDIGLVPSATLCRLAACKRPCRKACSLCNTSS